MEKHPLLGRQMLPLRLVVVVEDRLVDLTGQGVLGWVLVLDVVELEEGVRVAGRLDELLAVLMVEVLGRTIGDLHQASARCSGRRRSSLWSMTRHRLASAKGMPQL